MTFQDNGQLPLKWPRVRLFCGTITIGPQLSAEDHVIRVIKGELNDPTLSIQFKQGFRFLPSVLAICDVILKVPVMPQSSNGSTSV